MHYGKETDLGDSVMIDLEYDEDDWDDEIPEGCAACGGDYPHCTTSCPMFDD